MPRNSVHRLTDRLEINFSSTARAQLSQLMRLWNLSHRRPAKAQASLRMRAVSPEPLLFAHMKYRSTQSV